MNRLPQLLIFNLIIFIWITGCLPTLQLKVSMEMDTTVMEPGWITKEFGALWKPEPNCIATSFSEEATEETISLVQAKMRMGKAGSFFFTPFDLSNEHEEVDYDVAALDVKIKRFPSHRVDWKWDTCSFLESFDGSRFYFITEVWFSKQVRVSVVPKKGKPEPYTFQDLHEIIVLDASLNQYFNHAGDLLTFKDQKSHPVALVAYKVERHVSESKSFVITDENQVVTHQFFEDDPDPLSIKLLQVAQEGFNGPITEVTIQVEGEYAHQVEGEEADLGVRLKPNIPSYFVGKRSNERYKAVFHQDDADLEQKDSVTIEISKVRLDIYETESQN